MTAKKTAKRTLAQGRKPGSGRKPGYMVKLRREFIASKEEEAEWALAYAVSIMHGECNFDLGKFTAAREVMDRVWGRPAQTVRVRTWQDIAIEAIKNGASYPSVQEKFGNDLATELFTMAGVHVAS